MPQTNRILRILAETVARPGRLGACEVGDVLKKFINIENLGLLHATGTSPNFAPTTLIYAENGRGKSTLCSLIGSLEVNDTAALLKRQTLDQAGMPAAQVQFEGGPNVSSLQDGQWDHPRPNVRVFDMGFVRANVHSGPDIEAEHRRGLLRFVLGASAVLAAEREARATARASELRRRIRTHEDSLAPMHAGITLDEFVVLSELADIEAAILETNATVRAAESSEALARRPPPEGFEFAEWSPDTLAALMRRNIDTVGDDAELLAREHIARIGQPDAEDWLRSGQEFEKDNLCPYCGQSTHGSDLLSAFRTLFTEEYERLVTAIDAEAVAFEAATSERVWVQVKAQIGVQNARIAAWSDVLPMEQVDLHEEPLSKAVEQLRKVVQSVILSKRNSPAEKVSEKRIEAFIFAATAEWQSVRECVDQVNADLLERRNAVIEYKLSLSARDLDDLTKHLASLLRTQARFQTEVMELVDTWQADKEALIVAEREAEEARAEVRQLMDSTLVAFQTQINSLLRDFGADFQIEQMRANFRGEPQSDYRLSLRNTAVPLQHDSGPDFDTALSDGDKRTLALAFFSATVLNDPELSTMIVVVDDPMSSLDRNRREHTAHILCQLSANARQLIVTGHDPSFLRQVQKRVIRNEPAANIAEIQLERSTGGYSRWAEASLEELCEAEWLTKYREIHDFIEGGSGIEPRTVAEHIRPVLEGQLHRRFPRHIPEGLLLGQAIALIRDAQPPSPLRYAAAYCHELTQINTYAGKFHHDTNPGFAEPNPAVDAEVRVFAVRTMDFIHGRPPAL